MSKRLVIFTVILIVLLVSATVATGYYFYQQGYRVNFSIDKRNYQTYHHESPKFSFTYDASRFQIDLDEEERFGESYLVGLKLPSDSRVGCDVRVVDGNIKFKDTAQETGSLISKQISEGAEFFKSGNYGFIQIGVEKALSMEITVGGPLGELLRTDQVFVSHLDKTYTLMCGTSQGVYDYFADDFAHFFETFSWE
ncbi:hypothetical protein KKB83_03900 [Patescibacteria group bacterium]|nr:hypothetical protein [Patescibacteria group bacterium]